MKHIVTFKSNPQGQEAFQRLRKKSNVVMVAEPYSAIVFEDGDQKPEINTDKVRRQSVVKEDFIHTEMAILQTADYPRCKAIITHMQLEIVREMPWINMMYVRIPEGETYLGFRSRIMAVGLFTNVERDAIVEGKTWETNDFYKSAYHLNKIKIHDAWPLVNNNNTVDVAVLDVGFETWHEDMAGAWNNNFNAVTGTTTIEAVSDSERHGMSCAGIIGARTNNNLGVVGLGNNKVNVQGIVVGFNTSGNGSFSTSDMILSTAINKCIENDKCVAISMSFGGGAYRPGFAAAIQAARTIGRQGKGIVVLASAGNSNLENQILYPAMYNGVISVIASDSADRKASYSNFGSSCFMAAPGTGIMTTDRSGKKGYTSSGSNDPRIENYNSFSGTSAACPVLAGVVANMILANPSITEIQVKNVLSATADKVGGYVYEGNGKSKQLGHGRVNAFLAVQQSLNIEAPVSKHNITATVNVTPASPKEGDTIIIKTTYKTDKPDLSTLSFSNMLYYGEGDALSPSDVHVASDVVTIGGGVGLVVRSNTYIVPSGVGARRLKLVVDNLNIVNESNENDNFTLALINVLARDVDNGSNVDASITNVVHAPSTASIQISVKARNIGVGPISQVKYDYGINNIRRGALTVNSARPVAVGAEGFSSTIVGSNVVDRPSSVYVMAVSIDGVAIPEAKRKKVTYSLL